MPTDIEFRFLDVSPDIHYTKMLLIKSHVKSVHVGHKHICVVNDNNKLFVFLRHQFESSGSTFDDQQDFDNSGYNQFEIRKFYCDDTRMAFIDFQNNLYVMGQWSQLTHYGVPAEFFWNPVFIDSNVRDVSFNSDDFYHIKKG